MGSVYGTSLPIKSIMPHPTTVSRKVKSIAEAKRSEMIDFVAKYKRQGMSLGFLQFSTFSKGVIH